MFVHTGLPGAVGVVGKGVGSQGDDGDSGCVRPLSGFRQTADGCGSFIAVHHRQLDVH